MYSYVYRITNVLTKKHYYGKRTSKIPPKKDLGVKYFSSSTDKVFMLDQKVNTKDYKYKVVRIVTSPIEAVALEIYLHNKFDVGRNPNFYNKVKQSSIGFDSTGTTLSENHKQAIREKLIGRTMSETTREKLRLSSTKENLTIEARFAMGSANRGKTLSEETKEKLRIANTGREWSQEQRDAASKSRSGANNPRAKIVNIYRYSTDELIAEHVLVTEWCKDTAYLSNMLLQTLKRDVNRPYCFSVKNVNYNPLHYKDLYVKLVDRF